ncbi:N-acetylglutamate synthase; glutamate N-acetyltransferase [Syntrophobotulus glycolicus DSM 8271]|uniref:Arginine biosynthesis bifunctional protein ArgJ n=1 Tax=Syntrophobotulus glycolicus (strain DSM 8271 / FlGlyR) TaxID=645991 RepID=F0SY46_SYNGF|nr:bifunctional glutamate N-acetyltransferase/amino-acid acetyltransferase ArgJ [Syntrophobotulus glycolicus]ADY54796.1 N-acetylglutamate synthase; glutamate N-acetyltransferase [Syntrophobotulus glycolicus DSM 8271]
MKIKNIEGGVAAPEGYYAAGVRAGIKYKDKYDLAIIMSKVKAKAAAVYTRNLVKAHPLLLNMQHLTDGEAQAIVVNSGNANACMGEPGEKAALEMAVQTAKELGLKTEDILVASTGVIGQPMPMEKIIPGIAKAAASVQELLQTEPDRETKAGTAHEAALAIMTTDLVPKEKAYELECAEGTVKLGIIAKGSGMIHPNMGTMLCFITTDGAFDSEVLGKLLKEAVDKSFNMVTVDGDTSTNDMVLLLANGRSGIRPQGEELRQFREMLDHACVAMAKAIARDGEGATKLIEVQVNGAGTVKDAGQIVKSVCSSSLVKTAIYGQDANWGRILCAAGYSGAVFDPEGTSIYLNGLQVAQDGRAIPFSEDEALELLKNQEIVIRIDLKDGQENAVGWGCDLTHKYVDINADYRT